MKTDALNRHTHLLLMASLGVLLAGCAASRPAPVVHRTPVPDAPPGATAQARHEDMASRPGGAGPLGQSGQGGQPSGQGGGQPSDGSQVTPIYQGAINQPGRYGSADDTGVKVGPQGIKRPYGTPVPPPPAPTHVARAGQADGHGQPAGSLGGAQAAGAAAGKAAGAGAAAAQAGAQGATAGAAQASPVSRGEVSSKPAPEARPAQPAPKPASEAKAPPVPSATRSFDGVRFSWPVGGPVIQGFDGVNNKGLLVGGKVGEPVQAAAEGRVIFSGQGPRGYGNLVIIKHSNEMLSVYAHNRSLSVKEGDQVSRGQKIGELGDVGPGRTALHFEVRQSGKPVDPAGVLPKR